MAASVIGALRVNLGLDSAQFEKGAKRSQNTLKTMRNQFAVVAGAAAAMGAAIATAALKGAQDIDRAAKAARRLDSSTGGFRALELAAGEAGVSVSTLADAVQTMDREIAKGSQGASEALKRLGLSAKDLEGLDADQKIAEVADAIQNMGLSTADASVILQQLGIRNREMVLAVMSGGDALRQARADIEAYGLAISRTDSDAIEKANDQIGRLGLISQYVGQQLAVTLVPAMGRLAEVMTDSLREGGLLRSVIDGLVGNLDRLGVYVGVVVAGFGVRYVAALAAATFATTTLSTALVFLKGAILRTGIGILIVGAGELVYWLGRVVGSAGNVGEALRRVYEVGKATFLGVGNTAWGLSEILGGVANAVAAGFIAAFAQIGKQWDLLVNGMAAAWNGIAGSMFGESLGLGTLGSSDVGGVIQGFADGLSDTAVEMIARGGQRIKDAGQGVADAVKASIEPIGDAAEDARPPIRDLTDDIDDLGDSAGGKGAGGARTLKTELDGVSKAARDAERAHEQWANNAAGHFDGLITQGKGLSDVFSSIAKQLESKVWQQVFGGMGGRSGGGGLLSSIMGIFGGGGGVKVPTSVLSAIAPSFSGGGYTGSGARSGGLDDKGGFMAMLHPQETVIDHTRGQGAQNSGGAGGVSVIQIALGEGLVSNILQQAGNQTIQIMEYGTNKLPGQINNYTADPRRRNG